MNSNSYKIRIPQDVAQLFFSVLKKSRVLSNLLVAPTDVRVISDFEVPNYGALCYTHSIPIREQVTYRFSVDPSVNVTSDLILEWDVESPNDENSPHFVKNARFLFQGYQVPIITATTLSTRNLMVSTEPTAVNSLWACSAGTE